MTRRGTREGVDRLRWVTDDRHVVALAEPQVEQALLQGIDVLVLIHDELAVLAVHGADDVVALLENADREQQDVLEVNDPSGLLDVLVAGQQAPSP